MPTKEWIIEKKSASSLVHNIAGLSAEFCIFGMVSLTVSGFLSIIINLILRYTRLSIPFHPTGPVVIWLGIAGIFYKFLKERDPISED